VTPEEFLHKLTTLCRESGMHLDADRDGGLWVNGNTDIRIWKHGFYWDEERQCYAEYDRKPVNGKWKDQYTYYL
jgi:hypothetical protein